MIIGSIMGMQIGYIGDRLFSTSRGHIMQRFMVIREATKEEFIAYCKDLNNNETWSEVDSEMLRRYPDAKFYEISVD